MQTQETAPELTTITVPETAAAAPKYINPNNMYVYRAYFGKFKGTQVRRLNWSIIKKTSHVFVEATEGHMGAAPYTVQNVDPQDGFVDVRLTVDWGSPIDVYIDYLVING
ncbi:hypothetical protein [Microseira wollei]|uniref:Uncharacterized protein n=1 Tax=Microseira wollei NIES-4236 TaxID=2530354 RepID=A0AAV3XCE0_9CYAN|nr:hypothetical protein [Microseira wollei]GET38306.1 hypothetical protein MiSe_30620 [Microseira wollei NIES-4236]